MQDAGWGRELGVNGARLCPKDQSQRVYMEKRVVWFRAAATFDALRLVLRTQPRSVKEEEARGPLVPGSYAPAPHRSVCLPYPASPIPHPWTAGNSHESRTARARPTLRVQPKSGSSMV